MKTKKSFLPSKSTSTIALIVMVIATIALLYLTPFEPKHKFESVNKEDVRYEAVDKNKVESVSVFDNAIFSPSVVKIAPDDSILLAGSLTGDIYLYPKTKNDGFSAKRQYIHRVNTGQKGFPPTEAGLVGIFYSPDFASNHRVFFSYSALTKENKLENRVLTGVLKTILGKTYLSNPRIIFQSNTPGTPAHQIGDGVGLKIAGENYIMFAVGDSFDAKNAHIIKNDAGKILLLREDGLTNYPNVPFSENPKVLAMGIRNITSLTYSQKHNLVLITDTSGSQFDKILLGTILDPSQLLQKPLDLLWDGQDSSQTKPIFSSQNGKNINQYQFDPTATPVGNVFLEQFSNSEKINALTTLFGQTGSTENTPGKSILLLNYNPVQNKLTQNTLIQRSNASKGMLGHPVGLTVDKSNKNIFFADIIENRIYLAKLHANGFE